MNVKPKTGIPPFLYGGVELNIINVILDWLHILATTVWMGGMAF